MKKEINIFEIDGVKYWEYEYKMTKEEILKELDFFRKSNRPSYMFINALLTIRSYQNGIEYRKKIEDRLNKSIDEANERTVLYWTMLVIWLIVFGVWFFTIVSFLIDIIK